jgi:hypothetical protein
VNRLSRVEFEQLSADEQSEHVQDALTALRTSIPENGAAARGFIDLRLYVQELAEWSPADVQALWPLHRAGIEREASQIHAAFQEALDSGFLSPPQALFARSSLEPSARPIDQADEYL